MVISIRKALLAYAGLAVLAALTVHGRLLTLALIILGAIALKTVLHHFRQKLD
jgi:hypothetical protein